MVNQPVFTLRSALNVAQIPASGGPRLLYLYLEIGQAPQLSVTRAPVNLAVLVDASESMLIPSLADELVEELARRGLLVETIADGIPVFRVLAMPDDLLPYAEPVTSMDFVQEALRVLIERLGPDDHISLIAFAEKAKTLVSNCPGKDKRKILGVLDTLASGKFGDETYLAAGLQMALNEAQRGHRIERLTRVLLLTDGFAADEQQAQVMAGRIAASGFTLSTVGLGLAFNEGFLIGLAEQSGGNAHLVFRAQEISDVFAAELESTQRVVLRTLDLRIAFAAGIELRRAHRVQPVISELSLAGLQDRSVTIPLGELVRDQPSAVLLELVFPARPPGAYRLAQIVATGEAPLQQGERSLVRSDVMLQVTQPDQIPVSPDPRIMRLVETVGTFRLQTRALADAAAGDIANATRKLQVAATRLLAEGEEELASAVQVEIDNLQQQGQLSAAGTKKLRYETRKLTQKLG